MEKLIFSMGATHWPLSHTYTHNHSHPVCISNQPRQGRQV